MYFIVCELSLQAVRDNRVVGWCLSELLVIFVIVFSRIMMKKIFKKENMKESKMYSHKMQIYQEYRNKLNRENRDRMLAEQEANNPICI